MNDFSAMPAPQKSNGYSLGEMKLGSMLKLSISKIFGHDYFQS